MRFAAMLNCSRQALIALLLLGLLAGCGEREPAAPALDLKAALIGAPEGPVVAVVNGETITQPLFDLYARSRGLDPGVAEQRQQALDSLIENVLLAQALLKSEAADSPDVQAEAALVRMQQLSGRQLNSLRTSIEIKEQDIQSYYQREVERTGGVEYNAQHILFTDAAQAAQVLTEAIAPGADFEALMAKYKDSAQQSRDLGWGHLAQLPSEFVQVLSQLSDGEVSPVLVQTSYGFHVLRRVAKRDFVPPAIETVRDGARQQLVSQGLADRVRALRTNAQIVAPGSTAVTAEASSAPADVPATAPAE